MRLSGWSDFASLFLRCFPFILDSIPKSQKIHTVVQKPEMAGSAVPCHVFSVGKR